MIWSNMTRDQRIAAIKNAYQPGDSARLIAAKIGVTKSTIMGMYGRVPSIAIDCPLRAPPEHARKSVNPEPAQVSHTPPEPVDGYSLAEMSWSQCRWPVNDAKHGADHRFCGEPGFPYCEKHTRASKGRGTESERTAVKVLAQHMMKSDAA